MATDTTLGYGALAGLAQLVAGAATVLHQPGMMCPKDAAVEFWVDHHPEASQLRGLLELDNHSSPGTAPGLSEDTVST